MSDTLIGLCVQTALFLLGGYAMVIRNDVGSKQLKSEVSEMAKKLERLAEVIIQQAVQNTRLDNITTLVASMEQRVEAMRRGVGFIREREAKGPGAIDREY